MKPFPQRLAVSGLVCAVVLGGYGLWRAAHPLHRPLQAVVLKGLAPVAPASAPKPFPQPSVVTLPNGLRVFVLEDHRLPTVECRLALRAGPVFEMLPGTASLTAALITEGTQTRSELALAQATEQWGARLTVQAENEHCVLRLAGPSEAAPALLDVLGDVVLHPAFAENRLARVRFQQAALDSQQVNSTSVAGRVSGRLFYGDTPYALPAATARDYDALGRQDVIAFYERLYRPNGAVLGIVGDVRAADILPRVRRLFAPWPPAPVTPPLPVAPFIAPNARRVALVDWRYGADTFLTFQSLIVGRGDPDYVPLAVANQLLGGYSSGRLFQNLRESNGYTYGASSWLAAASWPGLWSAGTSVPYEDTQDAVRAVNEELRRLREEPVPGEELARAKRSLIGGFALTRDRPGDLLGRLMDVYEYGLPPDYWQAYPARVQAVTARDIQRIARKYLAADHVQIIAIGPAAKIEGDLRSEGPIDRYDERGYPLSAKHHAGLRLSTWPFGL